MSLDATAVDFSGLLSSLPLFCGELVPLLGLLSAVPSKPNGGNVWYDEPADVCGVPQEGDEGVGGGGAGESTELTDRTGVPWDSVSVSELSSSASSSQESAGSAFLELWAGPELWEICSLLNDDCRALAEVCAIVGVVRVVEISQSRDTIDVGRDDSPLG